MLFGQCLPQENGYGRTDSKPIKRQSTNFENASIRSCHIFFSVLLNLLLSRLMRDGEGYIIAKGKQILCWNMSQACLADTSSTIALVSHPIRQWVIAIIVNCFRNAQRFEKLWRKHHQIKCVYTCANHHQWAYCAWWVYIVYKRDPRTCSTIVGWPKTRRKDTKFCVHTNFRAFGAQMAWRAQGSYLNIFELYCVLRMPTQMW